MISGIAAALNMRRLCTTKAATMTARPLTPRAVMSPTATPSSTTLRSLSFCEGEGALLVGTAFGNDVKVGEIGVVGVAVGDMEAVGRGLLEGLGLGAALGPELGESEGETVGRKDGLCVASPVGDDVGRVVGVDVGKVVGCDVGTVVGDDDDGRIDIVGYDDGLELVVGVGVGKKLIVGGPFDRNTGLERETVAATLLAHVKELTFDI